MVPHTLCGITMRRDHEMTTVAWSDPLAGEIDELQYGRGQGPCLQVLHDGEPVLVTDLATEQRWPGYRTHALAFGVRSSYSLPLLVDGTVAGAMNFHALVPDAFNAEDRGRCEAFARQAAFTLTIVVRNADASVVQQQLRAAIESRAPIDQAVGIVMGQQRVAADQAFAVLRGASQHRNRKLRDIAADLIESVTGAAPQPARPFYDPR